MYSWGCMSCLPNVGQDALLLYLHNKTAFCTQNANNTEMLMCAYLVSLNTTNWVASSVWRVFQMGWQSVFMCKHSSCTDDHAKCTLRHPAINGLKSSYTTMNKTVGIGKGGGLGIWHADFLSLDKAHVLWCPSVYWCSHDSLCSCVLSFALIHSAAFIVPQDVHLQPT